jgi:hypothetical protein
MVHSGMTGHPYLASAGDDEEGYERLVITLDRGELRFMRRVLRTSVRHARVPGLPRWLTGARDGPDPNLPALWDAAGPPTHRRPNLDVVSPLPAKRLAEVTVGEDPSI